MITEQKDFHFATEQRQMTNNKRREGLTTKSAQFPPENLAKQTKL